MQPAATSATQDSFVEQSLKFPIVGIGASAGGVEALQALFRAMPPSPVAAAFIVVTHLGPDRDSALPEILQACTTLPVVPAVDAEIVKSGHVYVLANDSLITLSGGRLVLRLQSPDLPRERQLIDLFFASLAADQGERAVGIVLSGSGSDGTLGLKAIKEHGGFTLAQGSNGTSPRYPSMPASAAAGGAVDLVLPADKMPTWLTALAEQQYGLPATVADAPPAVATTEGPSAQAIISEIVRTRIGHDFSGYKDKTFFRRVHRRMQVLLQHDLDAYIAFLRNDPDEPGKLFRDLLISVTGFFRDPDSFAALASRVMPAIFEGRGADETVRIWVPGCATGEEAYSLAIMASEHAARRPGSPSVQIFATDIDETALAVARGGRYPAAMMTEISSERLARFFVAEGDTYVVSRQLRDLCVFSLHNLIRDAPFSRIDMVSCRNLLIYMGGVLQEQVIPLFHYALRPGGFLFLGVSETVSKHADLFAVDDKPHRIYRRRDAQASGLPLQINTAGRDAQRNRQPMLPARRTQPGSPSDLRQMAATFAAEQLAPPHLLVNADGDIVYQSANLGAFLEPSAGVPSRQLVSLARLALRMDLRTALREATEKRRRTQRPPIDMEIDGTRRAVTMTVAPLPPREGFDTLFMVAFAASEPVAPRQDMAVPAGADLRQAQLVEQIENELRETRERLQSTAEEYETATEELKSANEEMVSVNEELQSINEELETSKEELQSVNEELQTSNTELTTKIDELDRANTDMRNLFESTEIATLFLDRHLVIRSFTPAVTGIFDLVATDRGRSLTSFASHLDKVDFRHDAQHVLNTRSPVERRVTAHANVAHYLMRILPYTTSDDVVDGLVVTFFDITKVVEGEILESLVNELNHRVRNMLMVVSAVASHTLRRSANLVDFGKIFNGRIRALATAHELVSHGGWRAVSLVDLIKKELTPYATGPERLLAQGPPVSLRPSAAISLGMVLHEMATNATKHGALSVETGRLSVQWAMQDIDGAPHLVLHWVESGGPKVTQMPERRGFGSELMERQLRHDLKGKLEVHFDEQGLRITIALPADVIADRGELAKDPLAANN
jgi:two-component system, chemotaxis family, CheB/CheR fusion protein